MNDKELYLLRADDFRIEVAAAEGEVRIWEIAPREQLVHRQISISGLQMFISHGSRTIVHSSADEQITLIFRGELYNDQAPSDPRNIVEQYRADGDLFARRLNGSFVIGIIDRRRNKLLLVTDRLNSKKLYFTKRETHACFSTSVYLQPVRNCAIDEVAIAAYLANGSLINNRTLFEGIESLEGACVYEYTPAGLIKNLYWNYTFDESYAGSSLRALKSELADLLVAAVRRRLPASGAAPLLSLSGGYDSSAILGILGESLQKRDVECFSYGYGEAKSSSDEVLSEQMASLYGYRVRRVVSFNGSLKAVLESNARLGQGASHFCHEVDAWRELGSDARDSAQRWLFAGDECLGWKNRPVSDFRDALRLVGVSGFENLAWLSAYIGEAAVKKFRTGLDQELDEMISRCPRSKDWHDTKDYLYLKHRMNHVILPWRENFCGHFFSVANPLLDNGIIEFMQKVPSTRRKGKQLFIETVTEMFPRLFKIRRAQSSSFTSYWDTELFLQKIQMHELLEDSPSPVDDIVAPESLGKILSDYQPVQTAKSSQSWPRRLAEGLLRGTHLRARLASKVKVGAGAPLPVAKFLERVIAIKSFFAVVK